MKNDASAHERERTTGLPEAPMRGRQETTKRQGVDAKKQRKTRRKGVGMKRKKRRGVSADKRRRGVRVNRRWGWGARRQPCEEAPGRARRETRYWCVGSTRQLESKRHGVDAFLLVLSWTPPAAAIQRDGQRRESTSGKMSRRKSMFVS